jgi:Domain of unknown function (DUF6438)
MRSLAAYLALLAALAIVPGCAHKGEVTSQTLADVPASDITAIELLRTPCFGRCPAYTVRLTADGRARFSGDDRGTHKGVLAAQIDFRSLAAWIDSQHLETLDETYASGTVDAPGIELAIERHGVTKRYRTYNAAILPLRLEGVVLALEGEIERTRWRADDRLTPFLGYFENAKRNLYVYRADAAYHPDRSHENLASGPASNCGGRTTVDIATRGVRFRCDDGRVSAGAATADGFVARGDAIAAGRYVRASYPAPQRPLGEVPGR